MLTKIQKFVLLSTLYFLLSTFLIGCATVPAVPSAALEETVKLAGSSYISARSLSEAYNLDYHWDPVAKRITLSKADKEARMMLDSFNVLLNDSVRTLDKEIRLYQDEVFIPESFAKNTLEPFFRDRFVVEKRALPLGLAPIKTVIIDAGHGGKDPGAVGRGGIREKDVVLNVAKRLRDKLSSSGIEVILTRDNDSFVSLSERSRIANANAEKTDFFISIHTNSSRSKWISGVEVFYLSESIDDNLRSYNAAQSYALNFKERYSGKDTAAIIWDLQFTENRKNSVALAEFVCSSLSKNLLQKNRGIKPARFYVLKANIPAILVEVGFLSHPQEERKLCTAFYQDKIAQAITEGIIQYNYNFTTTRTARH